MGSSSWAYLIPYTSLIIRKTQILLIIYNLWYYPRLTETEYPGSGGGLGGCGFDQRDHFSMFLLSGKVREHSVLSHRRGQGAQWNPPNHTSDENWTKCSIWGNRALHKTRSYNCLLFLKGEGARSLQWRAVFSVLGMEPGPSCILSKGSTLPLLACQGLTVELKLAFNLLCNLG